MQANEDFNDLKQNMKEISYIAFEACQSRNERRERRHFVIEIILIFFLVFTNAAWLWYESKMDTVTETTEEYTLEGVEQTSENNNYIAGGDIYGETEN